MANLHHTPRLIAHWERELSRALDTRNRRAASRIARTIADHQRDEAFEARTSSQPTSAAPARAPLSSTWEGAAMPSAATARIIKTAFARAARFPDHSAPVLDWIDGAWCLAIELSLDWREIEALRAAYAAVRAVVDAADGPARAAALADIRAWLEAMPDDATEETAHD